MVLKVSILTLYPEMFPGVLGAALAGKALLNKNWELEIINIRDFATDKHKTVDDTPYGGGAGMVLRADVLARAIDSVKVNSVKYLMSPRGRIFNQELAKEFALLEHITIICGRFEGIDQRLIDNRYLQELSIGDFILSGGEVAALTILDSVIRLLPGTMGNANSSNFESFENNLLEYPQYTRPRIFENLEVPEILLNGNHKHINEWRYEQSLNLTKLRRPDLYKKHKAID